MGDIVKFEDISQKIVQINGQNVILDFEVAALYGVETKRVNEAVRNNPQKFPEGYVLDTDKQILIDLRSKISTANDPKSRVFPKAFTEKGLYMLATILKGDKAIKTTIAIIEAFAKLNFAVLKLKHTIKRKRQ